MKVLRPIQTSILALIVGLMFLAQSAEAGFMDGNAIYAKCAEKQGFDGGMCAGYIEGATDLFEHHRSLDKKAQCVPAGVTVQQVRDVYMKFLKDYPSIRNLDAGALFSTAITIAWSC